MPIDIVLPRLNSYYQICNKHGLEFATKEMRFESRNDAEIWMIRNQKGRRNVSTFVMVELGLKLEDLLKQKGLENNIAAGKINKFGSMKRQEPLQNSANPPAIKEENLNIDNQVKPEHVIPKIDTREEISKFANISHDTVDKVKKIKEKVPEEVIQKLRDSEISIN